MTSAEIAAEMERWPAVRDVVRETGLSQCYVNMLIHQGKIDAARTRLGWLISPESVAAFQYERELRRSRAVR
jgi:hypothetical protein